MKCEQCQRDASAKAAWNTDAMGLQVADLCQPCLAQLNFRLSPLLRLGLATITLCPLPKPKRRGLLAIWRTSAPRRWLYSLLGRRPVRRLDTFDEITAPRYEVKWG